MQPDERSAIELRNPKAPGESRESTAMTLTPVPTQRPSLDGLAASANREMDLGLAAASEAVRHWIGAGEYLLQAREQVGRGWDRWVQDNCDFSLTMAYKAMRLATYKDQLGDDDRRTLAAALDRLRFLPPLGEPFKDRPQLNSPSMKLLRRRRERARTRARAAREALRKQEQAEAIRRHGGDLWDGYTRLRAALTALDNGWRREQNREAKAMIAAAMAKLHAAEDELAEAVRLSETEAA